jgi:hypothetical protein
MASFQVKPIEAEFVADVGFIDAEEFGEPVVAIPAAMVEKAERAVPSVGGSNSRIGLVIVVSQHGARGYQDEGDDRPTGDEKRFGHAAGRYG